MDEISFGINDGDKIGLIGINGTGKSTLLKVLAGHETPDKGRILSVKNIKIEYLPQNPCFDKDITVIQHIFEGNSPVLQLVREYESILHRYNSHPEDTQLGKKLLSMTQQMDAMNAWSIEHEAETVLTTLGIFDFDANVKELSGGQKKRVALAGALIHSSDLLILDEPTNHIDNDTVSWLERYLNNRKGALLMVTHDRYFLNRVCNRIIELDNGRLYTYIANYTKYLEMKAEREELEEAGERKRQSLLRRELEWIKRGARARTTKQKARIERFEKLSEEKNDAVDDTISISTGYSRLGKKIIELKGIGKSYSENTVISDFSYNLLRDDRIGIIGPNGSGKSTFLKIIAGKLTPDKGSIAVGGTVKIGFFTQESDEMDETLRVIDYIRNVAEYVTTEDGNISASQMLELFLFPPAVQWTPLCRLSGGEKRRLYLLSILMGAPNVLLLDEPTNDLDIKTLTILENYLDSFPGAVLAVSHDRYFIDRIADKLFIFDGQGQIERFDGDYSDYDESIQKSIAETQRSASESKTDNISGNKSREKQKPLKLTFKEQREFEQIDAVILGLEQEIQDADNKMIEASSDFEQLQRLIARKEDLDQKLNKAMERWVYLNERNDLINSQKL